MELKLFQVDAFSDRVFGGNPAAICPLETWLPDELLQKIAVENNLSETAFFVRVGERYKLRWFTPTAEIDLCGHATLAAAFVIFKFYRPELQILHFDTLSGELIVKRKVDLLALDFPSRPLKRIELTETLTKALGRKPKEVYLARDCIAVFETEEEISTLTPNFELLTKCEGLGVAATAPGREVDFVSRAFFPKVGIPEDPVTGSTHCSLVPFWANRLDRNELRARQLSKRSGELWCKLISDRVEMAGKASLYLVGTIYASDSKQS